MKYCFVCNDEDFFNKIQKYFFKKSTQTNILKNYDELLKNPQNINFFEYDLFIFNISATNKQALDILDYFEIINLSKPVIFLGHGNKVELMSLVFGRNAEDYIHFPFEMKELELRISKAMRKRIVQDDIFITDKHTYTHSDRQVSSSGFSLDLTQMQRKILYLLITNKNNIVTYSMIQDYIYDGEEFSNNALSSHIRDIRKKIKDISIKSIKGIGYKLQLQ